MARGLIDRALRVGEGRKFKDFERRVDVINRFEPELELLDDSELLATADELRRRAREDGESLDDLLPEAFALVREAGRRTLGQRHFDVQMIGGMVLHDGAIAEMRTGEGKTLTATLAVFLNTLAGDAVHLVTVNDYLARRDAEWMSPIYNALGVSVGVIQTQQPAEVRRQAYAADVTYGTNSEFGFDYLRDNMAPTLEATVQPDHVFAIVDEVDNILIDEARTPLIISGQPEKAADTYYTFARLAKQMVGVESKPKLKSLGESRDTSEAEHDYEYDEKHKTIAPTEAGVAKAEQFIGVENLYVSEHGTLVNHLIQSLKAESLFKRDDDYAVIDGEVKIIDEFTGRILEGRRWSEGLHQAVEAKEGVAIREENQTLATITLQNYFRLYDKLSGMTGTALTEAQEFMKIYEMPVVEVPTNRADGPQRRERPDLQDPQRQVEGPRQRGLRAPRQGPADAGGDDLGRGVGDAGRASSSAAGSSTSCSTPSPSTRSARARPSPRPGASARSRSRPTWPAAASTSSSAATPSRWPARPFARPASRTARTASTRRSPRSFRSSRRRQRRRATRSEPSAGCSSAVPSATSPAGSTTSFAAAPGVRAIPASRASSSPPRTT